jgi:hypothetical protein
MLRKRGVFAQYSHMSLSTAIEGLILELPDGRRDYFEGVRLFAESIYQKLCRNNETYFLDKTPRYYLIISEIAEIFPQAKFIFLFRNPLAILASVIESFNRGRMGDFRHKIDLFKGPGLLAEGYRLLRDRSVSVNYEDLIRDADKTIKDICHYLNIAYQPSMISDFSSINLKGQMGDTFGSNNYKKLEIETLDKWKRVLGTRLRSAYAKKYLKDIHRGNFELFGYDFDATLAELDDLSKTSRGVCKDLFYLFACEVRTFFEIPMIKKMILNRLRKGPEPYIHY